MLKRKQMNYAIQKVMSSGARYRYKAAEPPVMDELLPIGFTRSVNLSEATSGDCDSAHKIVGAAYSINMQDQSVSGSLNNTRQAVDQFQSIFKTVRKDHQNTNTKRSLDSFEINRHNNQFTSKQNMELGSGRKIDPKCNLDSARDHRINRSSYYGSIKNLRASDTNLFEAKRLNPESKKLSEDDIQIFKKSIKTIASSNLFERKVYSNTHRLDRNMIS